MNIKDKNEKEKQANKILYITVVGMLVVMAVIVMITSALSRPKDPANSPDVTDRVTDSVTDKNNSRPGNGSGNNGGDTDALVTQPSIDSLPAGADTDENNGMINAGADEDSAPALSLPLSIGNLSKSYSADTLVYSTTMEDYRTHMGIDISAGLGERVLCSADGTVTDVWYDPMMGQCIKIEHKGGLTTMYKNLSESIPSEVKIGAKLHTGDTIGFIGETALIEIAEEPHLHFEVMHNSKYVNPTDFMSSKAVNSLKNDISYEG